VATSTGCPNWGGVNERNEMKESENESKKKESQASTIYVSIHSHLGYQDCKDPQKKAPVSFRIPLYVLLSHHWLEYNKKLMRKIVSQ
jgi:hypothetical protein